VNKLARSYSAVFLLLVAGLLIILADAAVASRQEHQAAVFSALPGNALAVPYFEARWRILDEGTGQLFPGMRSLSTMDFVYAP